MSQEGASRWARGNRCSLPTTGNDIWSIRWSRAEEILVHYYNDIHIRNADNNTITTPQLRWNPLRFSWGTNAIMPPMMIRNQQYPVTLQIQNTGTSNWECSGSYTLRYYWSAPGHSEVEGSLYVAVCPVNKGSTKNATVNVTGAPNWGTGFYSLRFDMRQGLNRFSSQGWNTYNFTICVTDSSTEKCKVSLPANVQ